MAEARESLYAQFTLLNYLQQSSSGRTVSEILHYLHQNTNWGDLQLNKNVRDNGLRNLQNWLKAIRESGEFGQLIQYEEDPANRKQFLYCAGKGADTKTMPIEEACFVLMAERFLDAVLPTDFYDSTLQDLFTQARTRLAGYEKSLAPNKHAIRAYLRRIAIAPRGQQLVRLQTPHDVMVIIYRAILNKRCLKMRYGGKWRELHPYAVIVREPKIYLLGIEEKAMSKRQVQPVLYLCNRIEQPSVSKRPNRVPADFSAAEYVDKGNLDVRLRKEADLSNRGFTLKLRVYPAADNLLQDLEEFPLSQKQTILPEPDSSSYLLTASGMRATFQLVEWILGRMDRVEVLAPIKLRKYIAAQIMKMHQLYNE